jgi:hypothetical protein
MSCVLVVDKCECTKLLYTHPSRISSMCIRTVCPLCNLSLRSGFKLRTDLSAATQAVRTLKPDHELR